MNHGEHNALVELLKLRAKDLDKQTDFPVSPHELMGACKIVFACLEQRAGKSRDVQEAIVGISVGILLTGIDPKAIAEMLKPFNIELHHIILGNN